MFSSTMFCSTIFLSAPFSPFAFAKFAFLRRFDDIRESNTPEEQQESENEINETSGSYERQFAGQVQPTITVHCSKRAR